MSNYIIDRTNPSNIPIEVAPAGKKTQAGITWKGKYYSPWGEALNENLLRLTENFASNNEPSFYDDSDVSFNRLDGQLWYHTSDPHHLTSKILKIQNSNIEPNTNGWKRLELVVSNIRPTFHTLGEQWYDTRDKTISVSRGNGVFDDLTVKKALDSDLLDGLDSLQFLRSDVDDIAYGTLELSNIRPRVNNTYDSGLMDRRWRNIYSINLVTNTSHSILPQQDDTYILGNDSFRWKEIDVVLLDTRFSKSLIPLTNNTYDLGNASHSWNNAHIRTLYNVQSSHLRPISNMGYDLGSSSLRWKELFLGTLDALNSKNLIPLANNTYVLGSSSLRWSSIDVEIIRNSRTENIRPVTNNSFDIGASGNNYRNLFLNNLQTPLNHYADMRYYFPTSNGDSPATSYIASNVSKTFSIYGNNNNNLHNVYFKVTSSNNNDGFIFKSNLGRDIFLVRQGNVLVKETDFVVKTKLKLESISQVKGCDITYNETSESIEFVFYE